MVIKVEYLEQLTLEFKESFVNEHNVKYYDHNKIYDLLKEEIIMDWEDRNYLSTSFLIPYRENEKGEQMESSCIFLLKEFKRGDKDNDDVSFTYEYNGTVS
jgi:hypothetical protein